MNIRPISHNFNSYNGIESKKVQLISTGKIYTIEEAGAYFNDVFEEYSQNSKSETIIEKITSVKDKIWQRMKRKRQ